MDAFEPCEYGDKNCEENECRTCGYFLNGITRSPARPLDDTVSRQDMPSVVGNSPRMKEAIKKAFDELMAMTDEELQEAMENAPDSGCGRIMIESGAHEILVERGSEDS